MSMAEAGVSQEQATPRGRPLVELDGLVVELRLRARRGVRGQRDLALDPRRRNRRAGGRIGLRQEHRRELDHADPPPARPRRRRQHPLPWRGAARARSRGAAAVPLAERVPRIPERDELAQPGHPRGRPVRRHVQGAREDPQERGPRARPATCSSSSASTGDGSAPTRTSSPAACASESSSRWRSRCSPSCCSWTSRRRRSTSSSSARSSRRSSSCRRELGFAVLFITHDLSLLVELSDRIAIMYAGDIVELAPADELLRQPPASLYGGADEVVPAALGRAGRDDGHSRARRPISRIPRTAADSIRAARLRTMRAAVSMCPPCGRSSAGRDRRLPPGR